MTSAFGTQIGLSNNACNSSLPHALLLAGSLKTARATPLAQALGIPVSALPIDASHSSLGVLLDQVLAGSHVSGVGIAVSDAAEQQLYERVAFESGHEGRVRVWVDRQPHRGPGGTVRDYCDDELPNGSGGGVLVIECSSYCELDFGALIPQIDVSADATVFATRDLRPLGVIHLASRSVDRLPKVGFYDIKQQLLRSIGESGGRVLPLCVDVESWRIQDISSYLSLISHRALLGETMRSARALIDPTSVVQGTTLIARDVVIKADAFICDSAILPSAVVGKGAIIARSVIPPGAHVPAGARVVDQVYATLASATEENE